MNVFKVIALFVAGSARELANEGKETLRLTKNLLILSILFPVALLVIGVGLGALGESLDSTGVISTGQGFIVVGSFAASLLMAFVLIRATVLAYVLVAASKFASKALEIFPDLKSTEITETARKLAGGMAFITGACLYAQVVPVWRAVGISLIAATSMLGLAYVMAAGWYNGKWAKVALTSLILLSLAFSTARIASPRFARAVAEYNQRMLGSDRLNATDDRLYRRFVTERDEIRTRAVDQCGGRYCNEADARRVAELEQHIARLQNGTYWESAGRTSTAPVADASVRPSAPPPVVNPVGNAGSADLPPPPAVPRRDAPRATADDSLTGVSAAAPARAPRARSSAEEVFRELNQFPDL